MKKTIITTATAVILTFTSVGVPVFQSYEAYAATTEITNPYNNQTAVEAKADELINFAKGLIGKATYSHDTSKTYPYRLACGSFIGFVFEQNGVDLATTNEDYMIKQGYEVTRDQLQKGDLVFFDSNPNTDDPDHVGMYIGDNKIIHMANTKLNVAISDLDSTDYYRNNYVTARRVLPSIMSANPATKGDKIVDLSYSLLNQVDISSTTNTPENLTFTRGGFTDYVYQQNGVNLGTTDLTELMKLGEPVAKENLKKGDLVFFNSTSGSTTPYMVGIYAGDRRVIVSSSSMEVYTRVLDVPWYEDHYLTARRVYTEDMIPAEETIPTEQAIPTENVNPSQTLTQADQIIQTAQELIGKATFGYEYDPVNYVFTGGGFTRYVFAENGIDLKDTLISRQMLEGIVVDRSQLQKGDIIYLSRDGQATKATQTGIYLGNNQFIYLSTKKGEGVVTESLTSPSALENYVTARRVIK